jgi:hypothetical protein
MCIHRHTSPYMTYIPRTVHMPYIAYTCIHRDKKTPTAPWVATYIVTYIAMYDFNRTMGLDIHRDIHREHSTSEQRGGALSVVIHRHNTSPYIAKSMGHPCSPTLSVTRCMAMYNTMYDDVCTMYVHGAVEFRCMAMYAHYSADLRKKSRGHIHRHTSA